MRTSWPCLVALVNWPSPPSLPLLRPRRLRPRTRISCCQVRISCSQTHSAARASVHSSLICVLRGISPRLPPGDRVCGAVAQTESIVRLACTGREGRTCAMTCVISVVMLRALGRGGDSGESEDDVTEMMSSGSGAQFCCSVGRGRLGW